MAENDAAQDGARTVEPDDASLLSGLRNGDRAAHVALCERFGPRVHRLAAARLSGDAQLAEDVMIQTLADAVRNISHFDVRRSSFAAWLYGIARRQIHGELRRQRRLKTVPRTAQVPMQSVSEVADGRDLAEETVARLGAQEKVAAVARVLSDLEFEVLTLSCVDHLSAREIGRIVGRSERAIHSLLHRARQKARRRLTADEH